ncbi:class I adenylate-forming enzyme family protein [Archangium sp.]|uniref:class I adenylate-forming enzyme family protein n=1 Tax=Archangium sp. TaxID=1872627 RepID=UPI002D51BA7A|nr:class I adenylate-forming enzyme family protein [Archangium sp.]HYO55265.1 class I adenylate-forming enzyme family protein [Archangium sp.]
MSELLRVRGTEMHDKPCIKTPDGNSALTYGELDRAASAFAARLQERKCRAGDRVILGLSNTPDFFVALFGCFRGGLIAVPVDANLAIDELQVIVNHAQPAAIIAGDGTESRFKSLRVDCEVLTLEEDGRERATATYEKGLPENPALLLYTSGTTGDPKGVLYSHATLLRKIESIRQCFGFDESYTSLCLLPTHFGHGLICNSLATFGYGGTLVITPPFNLDLLRQLWSILNRNRVNTFSSVPTVVRLLLQYAANRDAGTACPSLKFVTCASAPLRPEEVEAFQHHFNVPLLNCYGLTETCGWIACSPNSSDRNLASVGKALDCEIRAFDPNGEPLKPGEKGELRVRGPSVMVGYYKHSNVSGTVAQDGWLATGDVGEVDESGAVFLHSRVKEIIIRAGKNVYPAEVDSVLLSHPEVADACTVGLEDQLLGEAVAACVVRRDGSALSEIALIDYVRGRLINYKCPQRILFMERIPKTSRGKVNRSKLRSLFEGQ